MSTPKSPSAAVFPPESSAQAAERERLLPELLKQSKAATGTVQSVLRKMHDVLAQTKPGTPVDLKIFEVAKEAFAQLGKEPHLKVPPVLMQAVEFLKTRAAAMEQAGQAPPAKSGQTLPPKSAPPPAKSGQTLPPKSAPPPAAAQPRRTATVDGFEMPKRSASSISLVPASGPRESENQAKIEPRPGTPATIKIPGTGKLRG
jgi:hypothetical protein